ncbi:MAG: primosomal protein N', partial [Halobacteriovoraceae bacterium]|nr:primosomal protein N' [Halobacteriovoraceae bacterium]
SATPTVETITAFKGRPEHLTLKKRPKNLSMPEVEICDSRNNSSAKDQEAWPFNTKTLERIKEKLEAKEQVLVFVNRLGFASFVQCRSCGHDFHCLNCSSNLKYFKSKRILKCQFCEFSLPYPDSCPECGNMKLIQKGFGTEKLMEVLNEKFPSFKCERFDRDAVKTFDVLKDILSRFNNREIDLLVGTQMLSKGHDFAGVNLVVLLGVDGQLNFPDFRSNEKVFQLITQTAGRPGRSEKKGEVIIETLSPNNKIFDFITRYDQEGFYSEELTIRENLGLPPYSRLCAVYFSSAKYEVAVQEATRAADLIRSISDKHYNKVEILGPRPAMIEKRANKFTWNLLIKSDDVGQLHSLVENFQKYFKPPHNLALKVDIDPMTLS